MVSHHGQESPAAPKLSSRKNAVAAFLRLLRQLRLADPRAGRRIFLMLAVIFAVILLNTFAQVRLNQWQGAFYDAIDRRDIPMFVKQIGVFFTIVAVLLVLVVAQTWTTETVKVQARRWITKHMLAVWLRPRRAYLLGFAGDIGRNPDQRISQDANRLTDLSISFIIGVGQASMLLVSFIGVLWTLSYSVVFRFEGGSFTVPGYMVWAALLFSCVGSLLTVIVGRPLVPRNAERYASEGEFRTQLVRMSENAEVISLERGEEGERQASETALGHLIAAMQKLANAHARLTWVTSGYGWIGLAFPILVASPGYFWGGMTLGGLIMVVGGFNQVQNALRWFIDNYPSIAEWQAVLERVAALLDAIDAIDARNKEAGLISFASDGPGAINLENLAVCLPGDLSTCILLEDPHIRISKGERVLFFGQRGSGKTTLFMALAGLWPWGRGTVRMPEPLNALFLSERPYVPQGTVMRALAYPAAETTIAAADAAQALRDVGLNDLARQVAVPNHWDRDLSLGEQQRLGIARLLLHAPDWAVLDDCLSALDETEGLEILTMLRKRLPQMGVVAMSERRRLDGFYTRVFELGGAASLPPFTLVDGMARVQSAAQ